MNRNIFEDAKVFVFRLKRGFPCGWTMIDDAGREAFGIDRGAFFERLRRGRRRPVMPAESGPSTVVISILRETVARDWVCRHSPILKACLTFFLHSDRRHLDADDHEPETPGTAAFHRCPLPQ
ncbi:hypothetical protein [Rhizobium sp. ZPR3]|uniref:Uncharacterized protein n=2 Tax=unclassified Rhizobium TaxID=2613769 RepID=A0AAU7SDB3_9HYPH